MKQKVVIKISSMCCEKSRKKALKIAAIEPGVNTIGLEGDNQIIVTGEDIDAACLTLKIRKKLGWTDIISVTPIIPEKKLEERKPDPKKVEEKKGGEKKPEPVVPPISYHPHQCGAPHIYWAEVRDPPVDPCTIM
ncbi:hypothetical protein AQUCO_06800096v1 [Aquilegia coerulea]|uniref:HMA domain-containing protein n=1 Tax=Aquilegia coerulea TaxID=218851 RepID=A0A2G5CBN4_AQUCA|nr:hypothetical protein AQUCO_06800096v1 [Aquilegia coerulea]